jgi:hypothetical protein
MVTVALALSRMRPALTWRALDGDLVAGEVSARLWPDDRCFVYFGTWRADAYRIGWPSTSMPIPSMITAPLIRGLANGGIRSALLARLGLTGPLTILEGQHGVLQSFGGQFVADRLTGRLGDSYAFLTNGFKPYCCAIDIHSPIDAVAKVVAAHDLGGARHRRDRRARGASRQAALRHDRRAA